ncbi:MAG: prenyltransferase/squalene oxidase repeat-containing protein [Planctomycetota bacterium]
MLRTPLLLLLAPSLALAAQKKADEVPPRPPVPAALQAKINHAMDLGVESLLARQSLDGSWSQQMEGYGSGATGIALYALMKSGLPTSHPAVERGMTFVRRYGVPAKTYARATVLFALTAYGDPADERLIDDITDALVKSQVARGWAYPSGEPDLSCTQFAAMGLRAAEAAGAKVPKTVWLRLADAVLEYREEVDRRPTSGYEPRGFKYKPQVENTKGSMTAAGVAVLAITLDHVRGNKADHVRALEEGRAWLAAHFMVEHNPAPTSQSGHAGPPWYYLYGVERVGALLGVETFGEHEWYVRGAEKLISAQDDAGGWGNHSDTSFGLLFLSRATGSLGPVSSDGTGVVASAWTFGGDDPKEDVSLRASGRKKLTFWISSFGDDATFHHATGEEGDGPLAVERVEYWRKGSGEPTLLGEVVAEDDGRAARNRYAIQSDLVGPLTMEVFAAVHLADVDEPLRSKPLKVRLAMTERPTWSEYAKDAERNLFRDAKVEVTASSQQDGPRHRATNVIDAHVALGWKPKPEDEAPWIRIELARAIRANTIVLSHADMTGTLLDRFEILVDDEDEDRIEARMVPDAREKTVLELPKAIKLQSLTIRLPGAVPNDFAGLGEVEVQRRR